jgi:hypothetical protein
MQRLLCAFVRPAFLYLHSGGFRGRVRNVRDRNGKQQNYVKFGISYQDYCPPHTNTTADLI